MPRGDGLYGNPPRTTDTGLALTLAMPGGALERVQGQSSELRRGTIDMLSRRGGYTIDSAGGILGYAPRMGLEEGKARAREWVLTSVLVAPGVVYS